MALSLQHFPAKKRSFGALSNQFTYVTDKKKLKFIVSTKISKRSLHKNVFYRDLPRALAFSPPMFIFYIEVKIWVETVIG